MIALYQTLALILNVVFYIMLALRARAELGNDHVDGQGAG